jgi:hypothetical protein
MYLSHFRTLIASMPTAYQSSTSKRNTWASVLTLNNAAGGALRSLFGSEDEVCISRTDLRRLAKEPQLDKFVVATMVWGYPDGGQWGHLLKFMAHPTNLGVLTTLLVDASAQPITDWDTHFRRVDPIYGIGLSRYTKCLNFLPVNVCGKTALILDERIVDVARQGVFVELSPLRDLDDSTKVQMYPAYLNCIHKISNDLRVPAENIEFFLFEFGLYIKDIEEPIRVRAYQLYEQRGRLEGFALDDWLRAEADILGI